MDAFYRRHALAAAARRFRRGCVAHGCGASVSRVEFCVRVVFSIDLPGAVFCAWTCSLIHRPPRSFALRMDLQSHSSTSRSCALRMDLQSLSAAASSVAATAEAGKFLSPMLALPTALARDLIGVILPLLARRAARSMFENTRVVLAVVWSSGVVCDLRLDGIAEQLLCASRWVRAETRRSLLVVTVCLRHVRGF